MQQAAEVVYKDFVVREFVIHLKQQRVHKFVAKSLLKLCVALVATQVNDVLSGVVYTYRVFKLPIRCTDDQHVHCVTVHVELSGNT